MSLASTAAENQSLDGIGGTLNSPASLLAFGSLHTATPGTTGASEYAGVTRQASTYGNASGGTKVTTAGETYTTSGSTAVTDAGQWTLVSAGTYGIGLHLASSVTAATITFASGAKSLSST